jgi:hypothetical protein
LHFKVEWWALKIEHHWISILEYQHYNTKVHCLGFKDQTQAPSSFVDRTWALFPFKFHRWSQGPIHMQISQINLQPHSHLKFIDQT